MLAWKGKHLLLDIPVYELDMPLFKALLLFTTFSLACNSEQKETGELEDCPAIALPCPDGFTPCDPEIDNAANPNPCNEFTLGEEPCTQTRYCTNPPD